jgi:hypothetical protein
MKHISRAQLIRDGLIKQYGTMSPAPGPGIQMAWLIRFILPNLITYSDTDTKTIAIDYNDLLNLAIELEKYEQLQSI